MSLLKNKILLALSLGHFGTDIYANLLPMMFPLLMVPLGLTYARVGLAATTFTVASSLAQPLFGYLGDRFGSRLFVLGGICWIALFMGLTGFAWDYASLLMFVLLAGLGSAAFHPQGAMNAALVSDDRKSSAMSVFSLGGTAGFAVGPLLGGAIFASALGLRGVVLLVPLGFIVALYLHGTMKDLDRERRNNHARQAQTAAPVHLPLLALLSLILVVTLRGWTLSALVTYVPLLYQERGLSLPLISQVLFVFLACGAVGVLIGGFLSDLVGRKTVVSLSLLLLAPVVFLFLHVPFPLAVVMGALMGLLGDASIPVTVVMGQELLPRQVGMASGLIMGLAFITGAIGVSVTGFLADHYGLLASVNTLAFLPLLAGLVCLGLPSSSHPRGSVAVPPVV